MPKPEQFLSRKCPRCAANLEIYDGVAYLPCRACGANMNVIRKRGKVALQEVGADKPAAEFSTAGLSTELHELTHESARIRAGKIIACVVGGICVLLFGFFGISSLLIHDIEMGLAMLLCAGGSVWFVTFVIRDSRTVGNRIQAVTKNVQRQLAENERINVQGTRASELGVDQLIFDLFLNEIIYYPAWLEESRAQVPGCVTQAVKVGLYAVKLKMNESEYLFTLTREPLDDGNDWGRLDVCVDNVLVLSVSAKISQRDFKAQTASHYVTAFVETHWVHEIFGLSLETNRLRRSGIRA